MPLSLLKRSPHHVALRYLPFLYLLIRVHNISVEFLLIFQSTASLLIKGLNWGDTQNKLCGGHLNISSQPVLYVKQNKEQRQAVPFPRSTVR